MYEKIWVKVTGLATPQLGNLLTEFSTQEPVSLVEYAKSIGVTPEMMRDILLEMEGKGHVKLEWFVEKSEQDA